MDFPIQIEQTNGSVTAFVLGNPHIRAVAPTRAEAVNALRTEIRKHLAAGDLSFVSVPSTGVSTFGGLFKDDPTLQEIIDEIYRRRDAEPYPGDE